VQCQESDANSDCDACDIASLADATNYHFLFYRDHSPYYRSIYYLFNSALPLTLFV